MSLRVGANTRDLLVQPTFQNPEIPIPSGQKHYVENMLGRDLKVASPSFFQVNTAQAQGTSYPLARDALSLKPSEHAG